MNNDGSRRTGDAMRISLGRLRRLIHESVEDDIPVFGHDESTPVVFAGAKFFSDGPRRSWTRAPKCTLELTKAKDGTVSAQLRSDGREFVKDFSVRSAAHLAQLVKLLKRTSALARKELAASAQIDGDGRAELFGTTMFSSLKLLTTNSDLVAFVRRVLPKVLPDGLGDLVGSGAEGQVFDYGPGRVIKIFIVPDRNTARSVHRVLARVAQRRVPCVADIYDHGVLGRLGDQSPIGEPDWVNALYVMFYVAEKLQPAGDIDESELDGIDACLAQHGLSTNDFRENLDNVMRDAAGRLRLVDIGRVVGFSNGER